MLFLGVVIWMCVIQAVDGLVLVDNITLECGASNWTLLDTWCLRSFDHPSTWIQANGVCRSYQTNLVVVTDRQQNNDVTDLVRTVPGQYWIGLTLLQNLTGETWTSETEIASQLLADVPSTNGLIAKWSSGENGTILQGYWDVNEPDLRRGGCVYLSDLSRWAVGNCDQRRGFICQYAACPRGSFRCNNGVCINSQKRCDGQDDCGDDSDEVSCPDQCHFHVMSNQGQLSSPGYPGQYPNNTQCSWLIEGPPCSVVKVQFSKIETEPDFDEVRVLVGGRTVSMSEYVDRYSGNLTDVQVISPNNLLIIKFSSDHSNSFNGFTAQWEVVTHNIPVTGLPLVANLSLQEVTSPFYPSYYISEFLEWIISPQHARNVIKLQVLDLDLDEGDYVIVRHNNVYGEVLAVFSSIGGPSTVISVNALHITMKVKTSYSRQYHRGFRFSYTEGCDVILNEDMGMVFSPGYGVLNYPAYQNCSWTLVASQGRRPTLLFDEEFHLEDGYDFLQIYDGLNDTGEPLHPTGSLGLTGILAPPPLTSSTNQLHINLRSDSLLQYKGYRARFSIGCPDPAFNNNTMVSPSSSSYEFGSFLNISCKPGYTFLEEEFQHDNNTSKQYVEMRCLYGGIWNVINIPQCQARYCGPPPAVKSGYLLHGEGVQYGSSVTYSCEDGHIPTGNVTVVCQKDGMWETVPSCYAVNCSLPAIVPNATSVLESGSGWDFGSRVVYTCDAGFQLLGSAILFCLSNGTWNEEAPSCERVSCPVPEIEHGKVDTPGLRMLYKDTAALTCDAGFLIIGTSTVTCHANQTFGSLPSCEDVDECENDTTCDEISQNCINTMGSYMCHCKAGYQENGTFCQDIDECATISSNCSQDCENFAGGYQCICNLGYELYTANGTQGYFIPIEETGTLAGDHYHLNHTCVSVTCVLPPTPQDGFIMNRQLSYHFGDTLIYRCNLGFVLNDSHTIQCESTGFWNYDFPLCTVATCPSDGPNMWVNASVPATVIFPSVMRYLDVVSLICDVPGMETFNKTRQCLYDQPTDTYRLIGDSYECGEINCRVPYNLPNGKVELVTGTTFGSAFNITCDAMYYLHGNSSEGDKTVRCGSDGYWDYGSLVCLPVRCPDPGKPRGGSFVGTDFSLGGTVQFYCDDPELEVVGNSQLECVSAPDNSSLIWNSTLPICKDVIRPTITGCPVDSVIVNKYSSPMISVPVANDNIALANYTVSPVYFNPSDPTVENLTVVYTATDFSGNMEECRITILVLDESLPTIQCPESFTVYLTDEDHPYNLSISSANFSVSSSSSWTLDFGPQQVPVSAETLDKTFTVYGNITDTWGNSDTCWFQVKVEDICHPSTLTSPINGQLNCSATPDKKGYRCEATCNQDYYFYEDFSPNYDVFITECTVGGNWTSSHVPSCVSSSQTSFRQVQRLVYQSISNASVISVDCMGHYITSIQQTYPTVSERVSNVCVLLGEISIVTITSGQFSNIINNSFTGTYTLEFDPRTVDASHDCVQATSLIFTKTTLVMEEMKNIFGITDCPNITAEHETQVTNEQMCDDSTKTRDQAGTRVCLVCPPGTFKNDVNECELCPFGTYNEEQGMTSCSSCPLGTWTEKGGNSNASDCKEVCRNGLYSSTRLPPCGQCQDNSYPVSSHECQACPLNTKYIGTAAYLRTTCLKGPCQYNKTSGVLDIISGPTSSGSMGQCEQSCEDLEVMTTVRCTGFSYNSLLQRCVLHHGDTVKLMANSTYDHYQRTCDRLSDTDCYCVSPCLPGNRSLDGFWPCTECPMHYFSDRNQSMTCEECPPGTVTLATGATSNSSCVDAENVLCASCQNGATCRIVQHTYVCDCPLGYSGRDCEQITDNCLSEPCYNGATCTSSLGTYNCTCPQGVTGGSCEVDVDDCRNKPCQNGGICVDELNGYSCVCLSTFYGNNCELDNSTDVCASLPCDNGGTCVSVHNLWRKCLCPPGFLGQDCQVNIDECSSSPCLNGGQCVDGNNSYTCTCVTYKGNRCETPRITCDSLTCGNADECYDDYKTGLPQCLCNPGYTQEQGQSDCSLVDVCASSPCQRGGTCINIPGGQTCQCPPGYGGYRCQHDLDDCASTPCLNNGTCEDRFNNYTCDCPIGFTGRDCSSDIDECLSNPCHPPGTYSCNNTYGGFICNCNQGYSGLNCSVYTDNDPCVTNPCLHEGVCRRLTSGFICECENGWTGQRCEVLVNYCVDIANPCLNNASCVSLQNDFICRCPTGTYGRYCDQLPDLCSRLNPCLNLANCSAKGENFTGCSCATGFLGDGCQIRKNYNCDNSPCLNGATCSLDPGSHLSCTCAPGYYGEYCQFDVNECENVTCPGQGACIDGLNRYFCRCPLGKLLPDCTEDLTVTYDLCFESPWRTASASLPFSIPVNNQFLSLSFWVKFSAKTGTGTFLSVFEQSNPDFASGRELLFSFSQDGFLVSPDGTVDKENFGTYSVNNGQWHLIVMTWDTTIGELEVRVNTVRVFHLTNYHQGRLLDKFYWITLGNEFSPANMTSVPVGGFLGCISQVNIFSYILDTNVEVPSLMINPFTVGGRGDVLQWNEFELHGLVSRIRPSTVMDPVCDDCSSPDRTIPTLTCPKDVYLVSTHPYSPVSWSLLQHEEGLVVKTNMTSGTALSIGRHTVVYSASDVNNNTAVCSFRIYIKENNCEFPDLFGGVEKTCQTGGDGNRYTGCSLSCPSSGYTLSRVTPLSYTCGPLGWWETGVDQKCAPIYPTCGNITSTATVNVKVRLVYPATLTACDQVKDTLEMYTREHINTLDTEWGSKLCSQEDCEDVVLSVNCSSATPVVEFIINNVGLKLIGVDGESKSPEQIFTQALLDQNRFHFKEMIPNADPVIILSAVESSLICPDGYLLMGTDCVTCGFGTYLNLTTNLCDYCAKGFYYVSEGNTSCRACPEGTTTECPAAVSLAQCHVVCENGSFFNLTTQTCEICPMGTYQDQSGQFECLACPYNQTTIQNGTTDVKFCFDDCPSGFEVDLQGSCSECVVGTFRVKGDGLLCVPCPPGFTTPSTGSHSILNCTTVICSPGYRADSTNTHCERCPIGHYQPDWNQLDCLPCPENTTTRLDAADNQTLCEDFCLSGYERVGLECVPCPVGQYKNNSYGMLESCVTCPHGYVTPLVASTSSTNCSIYNCTEGSKINYNNTGCELCPLGEYQPQKYQTDCLPCANGSSTRQVGATVCEVICPSGQQLKDGQCEPCPVGYYRNNTGDLFGDCQLCPVDFITDHQGATSVDMCIIGNCTSGQYLLNTTLNCTDCPVGTYQPQKWQTACISCPNDTTTQGEGASQRSQCFLYCDAGYEGVNTTCDPCPVGYYKSMAGAIPCLACPSGNRTLDTGATNKSQCHVAACEPGTYLQNNTCKLCPYGQYQRDKWQDDCVPCPPETTTYHLGAANLSSCVKDCEGGFEYSSTTGQCEMCDQGYYRDRSDPTQAQCHPCPLQTITSPGQISTSIIFCFIANCTVPGEYRNPEENLCQPCPRGQYQDQKWQDSCEQCPENYTTFSVGAVSRDQCHMACDSGYEEVNATCVACAVGTFRNQQDTQWCRNCSVGWTTTSTATTEADQCVPNCTRGQYYSEVNGQCELCDRGTYQMELYQRQCSPCGQGTDTRTDGATARDDCLSLCHNLIHNCSEHAHCEVNGNRSTCTCKLGYLGDGYHCQHRCNTSDYCFNGGTCVLDVTQSIGCQCHFKYTGDRCQYRKDVESIVPQTWTIIVGSVVGSVAFLSIFIIVSVLLGVTYRHHKAYKMKNAINSLKKKKMSRPFVTRASLSDYGSPTEPPFRLPDSSVQKTNSFNWSPVEEGKLKDVNHIDMGNGMDDSIYQPPREEP